MSSVHIIHKQRHFLGERLLTNSLWNLFAYMSYTVVTVISGPIYIRFLGVSDYGLLVLLTSILTPLGLLNFGFGNATIKYIAESYGRGEIEKGGEYLRTTLLFNIGVGIIGALTIVLLANFLSTSVFEIETAKQHIAQKALIWIALGWLVTQISATFKGVPIALQKYKMVSIITGLSTSLNIVIGLLVLVAGGDLLVLIQVRLVWNILIIGLWGGLARRMLPGIDFWPKFHEQAFIKSFRFGVWQVVSQIGGMINNQADKFMLGIYVSTSAVGLFSIPMLIFGAGYNVIAKLGEVLFPAISDLQGTGNEHHLMHVVLRSSWLLNVLMAAIMGTIVVFAHDVLRLYVGSDIANSSAFILKIFAALAILSAPSIGIGQFLLGTGRTNWQAITAISTGSVTLAVSMILIPRYGLHGAAWSDLVAIVLSRPLIHFLIWRKYWRQSVPGYRFFSYLYGPSVGGIAGMGLLIFLRTRVDWQPGWAALFVGGAVCVIMQLTLVLMFDCLLSESEKRRKDIIGVITRLTGFLSLFMARSEIQKNPKH